MIFSTSSSLSFEGRVDPWCFLSLYPNRSWASTRLLSTWKRAYDVLERLAVCARLNSQALNPLDVPLREEYRTLYLHLVKQCCSALM